MKDKQQKAERLQATQSQGKVAAKLDLDSPKERAVIDVLAAAMCADGKIVLEETTLVIMSLSKMLGLEESAPETPELIRQQVNRSVAEMEKSGRAAVLQRAVAQMETPNDREHLFALAAMVTCADGTMDPAEADFLVELRQILQVPESASLAMVAGVARMLH